MKKKRKNKLIFITLFSLIIILWISGLIPKQVGKNIAKNYVNDYYSEMNLRYKKIEFSSVHGDYIAIFEDQNGKVYNFLLSPKFWPKNIMYDPINPPGP